LPSATWPSCTSSWEGVMPACLTAVVIHFPSSSARCRPSRRRRW
jgi:hypothetical protein